MWGHSQPGGPACWGPSCVCSTLEGPAAAGAPPAAAAAEAERVLCGAHMQDGAAGPCHSRSQRSSRRTSRRASEALASSGSDGGAAGAGQSGAAGVDDEEEEWQAGEEEEEEELQPSLYDQLGGGVVVKVRCRALQTASIGLQACRCRCRWWTGVGRHCLSVPPLGARSRRAHEGDCPPPAPFPPPTFWQVVVDGFYRRVLGDEELGRFFVGVDMSKHTTKFLLFVTFVLVRTLEVPFLLSGLPCTAHARDSGRLCMPGVSGRGMPWTGGVGWRGGAGRPWGREQPPARVCLLFCLPPPDGVAANIPLSPPSTWLYGGRAASTNTYSCLCVFMPLSRTPPHSSAVAAGRS